MGGITSKTLDDIIFDENPQYVPTPVTSRTDVNNQHFLDLDPRSPTCEVPRTPIVVDNTPLSIGDPRSPVAEFNRTPIVRYNPGEKAKKNEDLESSYLDGKDDENDRVSDNPPTSPESSPSSSDRSSSPTSPQKSKTPPPSVAEPLFEETLTRSISNPNLHTDESQLIKAATASGRRRSSLSEHGKNIRKSLRKTAKKAKTLFPSTPQSSPKKKTEDIPVATDFRSPLAAKRIDPNSPLTLVQRKQVNKLSLNIKRAGGTPSSRRYTAINDKENQPIDY